MSLRDSLSDLWRRRSQRERAILGGTALFIGLTLIYALVWEPGMAAREKLSATLPRMRAQLEDMRLQQKEVIVLRKQLDAAPKQTDLKALLQASASGTPFGRSVERVEAIGTDRTIVIAGPLDFDTWLDWVARVQRELGARVDTCKIMATERPGLVRVEVTFVARGASTTTRVAR